MGAASPQQKNLPSYDSRRGQFNRVRAQAVQWIRTYPGITCAQLKMLFAERWQYVPEVQNRLREAENQPLCWIEKRKGDDGLLHYYPKDEEAKSC